MPASQPEHAAGTASPALDLDRLAQYLPAGAALLDRDLRFTRITETFASIEQRPASWYIGRPLVEALPTWGPLLESACRAVWAGGTPTVDLELPPLPHEKHSPGRWLASCYPLHPSPGPAACALIIFREPAPPSSNQQLQSQLRTSAIAWQTTFDAVQDMVMVLDRHFRIVQANAAVAARTGLPRDKLVGSQCFKVLHGTMQPLHGCPLVPAILSRRHEEAEIHDQASGSWFIAAADPVFAEDGSLSAIVHTIKDITRRKHNEMEIQESRRRLQLILDSIADGFNSFDRQWRYSYVNAAAAQILRQAPEQLLGKVLWDLWPRLAALPSGSHFRRALAENIPLRFEDFYPDPLNLWFEVRCYPSPEGLSVFFTDITERKRATEALSDSELLKGAILSSLPSHIAVVSRDGTIIAVNQAWRRFADEHGGSPAAVGIGVNYLACVERASQAGSPEAAQALQGIRSVLDGSAPCFSCEYRCDAPETPLWFAMTVTPLSRPEGGAVIAHRDVSARKNAELQLHNALEELRLLKDRLQEENVTLRREVQCLQDHNQIVARSAVMRQALAGLEQVAPTDSTVLILGETGTGKELFAEAVHRLSRRQQRELVKVNCAALPAPLIENELFGREKGAYTGAVNRQVGRFQLADGATIFLDEIGELPLELQPKLLRVLQDGTFERLGSTSTLKVDVRVIAASNRDLALAVEQGRFRRDLYYRLSVFPILVPPLRDRREDIPLLVWAFVREFAAAMGKTIDSISARSMDALLHYDWPGNVRELRNVVERSMIACQGHVLHIALPPRPPTPNESELATLEDVKRRHILRVLDRTRWRIRGPGGAAALLDLKPSTLESMMARLGIRRSSRFPT